MPGAGSMERTRWNSGSDATVVLCNGEHVLLAGVKLSTSPSLWRSIKRVIGEVGLLSQLTLLLIAHFKFGYLWIRRTILTFLYAGFLSPALLQLTWYYFTSRKVLRSVQYGRNSRNCLDIFLPPSQSRSNNSQVTIVYINGGAWIIGYKGWGALFGKTMSELGYLTVSIDHRNFPQATISDMVLDLRQALDWVLGNIDKYGGDPEQVVVVAQESGAHILALALLQQLQQPVAGSSRGGAQEDAGSGGSLAEAWLPSSLKLVVGVSGAYDVTTLVDHFDRRGLYRRVFMSIMEAGLTGSRAHEALPKHSPTALLEGNPQLAAVAGAALPPFLLVHGSADRTIPYPQTEDFHRQLRAAGVVCGCCVWPEKSHTDPIIEDVLLAGSGAPLIAMVHAVAPLHPLDVQKWLARLTEEPQSIQRQVDAAWSPGAAARDVWIPDRLVHAARTIVPF